MGEFSQLARVLQLPAITTVPDVEPEPDVPDGGPYCPGCNGARWLVGQPVDPVRGVYQAQLVRCPDCQDWAQAQTLNRLAALANLSPAERSKTFDKIDLKPKGIRDAYTACHTWAEDPAGWLVVHGGVGSGKTHLALAVANAIIARGESVTFWYAEEMLARLRLLTSQGDRAPKGAEETLLEIMRSPVLIIDDLGATRGTDFAISTLERLADYRYREARPTMWTCIGSPETIKCGIPERGIPPFSESIGRRFQDSGLSTVVCNEAPQWL